MKGGLHWAPAACPSPGPSAASIKAAIAAMSGVSLSPHSPATWRNGGARERQQQGPHVGRYGPRGVLEGLHLEQAAMLPPVHDDPQGHRHLLPGAGRQWPASRRSYIIYSPPPHRASTRHPLRE